MAKGSRTTKVPLASLADEEELGCVSGDELERFVDRRRFRAVEAPIREVVEWVANNLAVKDVRPEDAPSPAAWSLLCDYRGEGAQRGDFWKEIGKLLLPSRSVIEQQQRFSDTGQAVLETVSMCERAAKSR